ncbi:PREDICTED: uncharacterized protein LOC105366420 [Ceratosolen solmsi marchali]|uniref:Uncharacterized protein LOC105366420 n=1 Tax=Ceratosolen solmsi marchali TaxID=326594 RepID=A0AAJ6YS32_9HYME|nr:PREDICTED: uncharacterized protein LOC105366420 [Ceratosolen solmsi marchali]
MEELEMCYGPGSIAGAVIGTFLTTSLLIGIAALLYKQWRRNKGKHLVLVTDPEIVEEAYAFDNPCFKDTTPAVGRSLERPNLAGQTETTPTAKDAGRWSTAWSNIGRSEKRRTLDDSCLGMPKATKVSVVGLRSRDFTGLGFNVCGNMREGIFVKDLLHRGPASESGHIHPGDRISSVKISFRSMVYEDALTILSYASPYDVELEVENGGGSGSKPATLLKKSVGPSPAHICHPLYRSQSIPDLSQERSGGRKYLASKRLFTADLNDSTIKSTKSTPGSQSLERRHEEIVNKNSYHHHNHQHQQHQQPKFGIRVLPALDGTVYRVENQNEHNTNLERRHSRKLEFAEKRLPFDDVIVTESIQQRSASTPKRIIPVFDGNGLDVPDHNAELVKVDVVKQLSVVIPSEVPQEVHNAAMAARRNRKSSNSELMQQQQQQQHEAQLTESTDVNEAKSPQKSKRKAPAPPGWMNEDGKLAEEAKPSVETQKSLTMIELNPADITVHHSPVPDTSTNDTEYDDNDDVYRKAASLGDLSKYESKTSTTLERAQSLDMTDSGSKKRKAPMPPPEDINESTEDLTKLDQIETFDRRKLKKSSEWGTLEDAIWSTPPVDSLENRLPRAKSNNSSGGTLERSKSNVEIKIINDGDDRLSIAERLNVSDDATDTSLELYNLPLSKKLSEEIIKAERLFDPNEDNALARIVNDGKVVKTSTAKQIDLDFRKAHPPLQHIDESDDKEELEKECVTMKKTPETMEAFEQAVLYFDNHAMSSPLSTEFKVNRSEPPLELYTGKKEVIEEPITKVIVTLSPCPGCENRHGNHSNTCTKNKTDDTTEVSYHRTIRVEEVKKDETEHQTDHDRLNDTFETHFAKPVVSVGDISAKSDAENDEDSTSYGPMMIVNSKDLSSLAIDKRNVSNVSVSSGESCDDFERHLLDKRRASDDAGAGNDSPQKLAYVTEIKVSPTSRENNGGGSNRDGDPSSDNDEVASIMDTDKNTSSPVTLNVRSNGKLPAGKKPPVPPRRSDVTRFVPRNEAALPDRQVVYVSEYKSSPKEDKGDEMIKFENWIFLKDTSKDKQQEVNTWSNGSSPLQPVTNIVLSSSADEKIVRE